MEFIIINENSVKITLKNFELKSYGIDTKDFGNDNQIDTPKLKLILNDLTDKTGFYMNKGSFFIDYYPSKSGGCEMFITNINSDVKEDMEYLQGLFEQNVGNQKQKRLNGKNFEKTFHFKNLYWLTIACRKLSSSDFQLKSSIYHSIDNEYYLKLSYPQEYDISFLLEYSEIEPSEISNLYLSENADVLCEENAVEVFCRL